MKSLFGYIIVNKPEMKFKEFDLYHAYYCGLCRSLKKCYGMACVCSGKSRIKKQRSPETLQQTGFPDFVEGAELLFCQTSNILADAVHLTVQQLRVFCGFQVR